MVRLVWPLSVCLFCPSLCVCVVFLAGSSVITGAMSNRTYRVHTGQLGVVALSLFDNSLPPNRFVNFSSSQVRRVHLVLLPFLACLFCRCVVLSHSPCRHRLCLCVPLSADLGLAGNGRSATDSVPRVSLCIARLPPSLLSTWLFVVVSLSYCVLVTVSLVSALALPWLLHFSPVHMLTPPARMISIPPSPSSTCWRCATACSI